MGMTIDHLRVDHRVTVLRDFTDANGLTLRAGASGVIRALSFDPSRLEVGIEMELETEKASLLFWLKNPAGPRLGHMKDFFEVGDDVAAPRVLPIQRLKSEPVMLVPPPADDESSTSGAPGWWGKALALEAEGKDAEAEQTIRKAVDHIGAASSIAEMYAQRMRRFQREGDEPRAAAAFKQAVAWMATYAGWATSGGEGAALSMERDDFHAALVREFGFDPTEREIRELEK